MEKISNYIALEGIDTAGKSTQIARLKSTLGNLALFTKEPSSRKIFEFLESGMCELSEFLLFLSDRAQHFVDVLEPNVNKLIISDRSLISGIAYSKFDFALDLHKMLLDRGLIASPRGAILLELDSKTLQERLGLKKNDVIESRGIEFLLGAQERMIEVAGILGIELKIIDARQSEMEVSLEIENFLYEMHCL